MRLPKRGEKGFTLIELLIVVAILGVLAAVIIPNVGRFMGAGEEEARRVEYNTVKTAVAGMMVENGFSQIPNPHVYSATGTAVNDMGAFPDTTSAVATDAKLTDPDGVAYAVGDKAGYLLYAHDITGGGDQVDLVNYISTTPTKYYYTAAADGTIRQFNESDLNVATNPDIEEYTY